jgi:ABC-type antimicrobial peptide transport system permease subunit
MIVIYRQVDYLQTKNLGYEKENLVYFPIEGKLSDNYEILKQEIAAIPGIASVSHMTENPTSINFGTGSVKWTGSDSSMFIRFAPVGAGYDFVKTMKLQMSAGRDFSKDFAADSAGYLINETALKIIGYKNPIGQPLTFGDRKGNIIGVIKDFYFQSMHTPIRPLVVYLRNKERFGNVLVRIEAGKTKEVLAQLEKVCKALNPAFPFTYNFTDEEYSSLYKSEETVSSLSDYFAFIAIFISCLGLLGLAMFTAEQRKKEIGIRKVLGATAFGIISLLSKDFLNLVFIACIIAFPVAWWAMNNWLQDFAYRINISWWFFVVAAAAALLIALATISFQAIKAAIANPVKSLRME